MKLDELCKKAIRLKQSIDATKKELDSINSEIESAFHEQNIVEGVLHASGDLYKVTVTKKLNRSLDIEAYQSLDLPENAQFVDFKPSINLKRMRAVEQLEPSIIEACVTVKPAKSTIKIEEEEVKDGN